MTYKDKLGKDINVPCKMTPQEIVSELKKDSHIQHLKERCLHTGCGFNRGI